MSRQIKELSDKLDRVLSILEDSPDPEAGQWDPHEGEAPAEDPPADETPPATGDAPTPSRGAKGK